MKMHRTKQLRIALSAICFLSIPIDCAAQVKQAVNLSPETIVLGVKAADPFDIGTGIYSREYVDLLVQDTIPIKFARTQRNMDPRSRSFGVGGSTSYDMFIVGDVERFSWVALVMADGSQIRYKRTSRGKGFADAVFQNRATPGEFLGSRISWDQHGAWTVALSDGTGFRVQGCDATSKPGQCAVTEIKNARGERVSVRRDNDGNILRITSPHGHFISVTNDLKGRITRVEDDSHKWVSYKYDDAGCLSEAQNWRGDQQQFTYDDQFNMTFVHEEGPQRGLTEAYDFTVTNSYDDQNRFESQRVSTGEAYSAKYITDSNNHVREADVDGPGGLSRYFFNESGYEYREQFLPFVPAEVPGWTLERVRDPNSNATVDLILRCSSESIRLPLNLDFQLAAASESGISYLTQACEQAEEKLQPPEKPDSSNEQ
jgi:YD repeat-containing protein